MRHYAWADCPTCKALTEEPCRNVRTGVALLNLAVHRDRPAFDVTATPPQDAATEGGR